MRKAVFLDRDGVINRCPPPHEYVKTRQELVLLPGAAEAIRALNELGYLVLVVTNQRGVARGLMTMSDVDDIHRYMCDELGQSGAHIDKIYVCPHDDGQCTCRKPNIGLFLQAEQDYEIDKAASWMIGDSASDIEAGQRYGVRTILTSELRQAVDVLTAGRDHRRG